MGTYQSLSARVEGMAIDNNPCPAEEQRTWMEWGIKPSEGVIQSLILCELLALVKFAIIYE